MKHLKLLLLTIAMIGVSQTLSAQCTSANTAFQSGEYLSYNLYFNWKFVWVKVGTASMSTVSSTFQGKDAYRCSLTTRGNGKLDKYFVMRDTLLAYTSKQLAPLYFRKGAEEGDRYRVDEVFYTYANNKCNMRMYRKQDKEKGAWKNESSSQCVSDMLNLFIKARNFDSSKWTPGWYLNQPVADGAGIDKAILKFEGRETVKGDDGNKYRCVKLSYSEFSKRKNKWRKIATFYATDDANHIPVRIDLTLNFGSAKAFVAGMKGIRNPIKAKE